ncbi:MAG: hypothetical protein Q7W02_27670 [Candidatus Rokubacteria bacterium]|nr:hypothetical protein [Candidatus Rokubacteria bacterium]
MGLSVFLRGLAIGFGIAAPVGPIGIPCIRRTVVDGRAVGGLFLCYLGVRTWMAAPAATAAASRRGPGLLTT